MPAISGARRNAAAIKCSAHLSQIGQAFKMYMMDNRMYYPPAKMGTPPNYQIGQTVYSSTGAFWFDFIAKYVSKVTTGSAATNADTSFQARNTILWGCPAWEGYSSTSTANPGGFSAVQVGYGMNAQ